MPTCGAVIQPIAVSVVSTASPLAAAAHAAMPPVTTSGRAGRDPDPDPALPRGGRGLRVVGLAGRRCFGGNAHKPDTRNRRPPAQAGAPPADR